MGQNLKDLRKAWGGLLGLIGRGASRKGYRPPSLPGNFTRGPKGHISERRRGFGSAFQPSNVPGAKPMQVENGKTSGSTMATSDSAELNAWRGQQVKREKKARQAWGGGLFRSVMGGDLAKGTLSEAELQQRRDAAKKSAEARRKGGGGAGAPKGGLPGGPTFSPTRRSIYGQYVPSKADRAGWDATPGKDQAPTEQPKGAFARYELTPQVPKALGEKGYVELGRWAHGATRDARPDIYARAEKKRLLPADADPKAVRMAYNHARQLAHADVGLLRYDFAQTDETIERLKPLVPFMRYTRESLQNVLLSGRPGEWAPFRREFGREFKDGRVYAHDTRGQKAGEPKKYLERNLQFLRDKDGKAPAMRAFNQRRHNGGPPLGKAAEGATASDRRIGSQRA